MGKENFIDTSLNNRGAEFFTELDKRENENFPSREDFSRHRSEFISQFIDSEIGLAIRKDLEIFENLSKFSFLESCMDQLEINYSTLLEIIANFYYGLTLGSEEERNESFLIYPKVQRIGDFTFKTAMVDVNEDKSINHFKFCMEGIMNEAIFYKVSIYDIAFLMGIHEGDHIQYLKVNGNLDGYTPDSDLYISSDREFLALAKGFAVSYYYWGEESNQTNFARSNYVESLELRRDSI
jgi:hypothetical protein